jgi:hypothetical protein
MNDGPAIESSHDPRGFGVKLWDAFMEPFMEPNGLYEPDMPSKENDATTEEDVPVEDEDIRPSRSSHGGAFVGVEVELTRLGLWAGGAFICVQVASLALSSETFFGHLTGGEVQSLRVPVANGDAWRAFVLRVHIGSSIVMWTLAALQIEGVTPRHGSRAWLHRAAGKCCAALWFLAAGPTAFWLSLRSGTGAASAQLASAAFSLVSMEFVFFTTYFFARALVVIRARRRGARSVALHARLVKMALFCSASILWQRPLQLLVIAGRATAWRAAAALSAADAAAGAPPVLLDHAVVLSNTTVLTGGLLLPLCVDGPRARLFRRILGIGSRADVEEAFGSASASPLERWAWRLRTLVFLLLRFHVTGGFTRDPAAAPAVG